MFRITPPKIPVLLALAQLMFSPAYAEPADYYFPKIRKHHIKSKHVDQTYEIFVVEPVSKKDRSEKFPVLYMTDANADVPMAELARSMQVAGEIPRFIIVGIGYPVDTIYGALNLRQRDLTPTQMERPEYGFPIEGIKQIDDGKTSGGAEDFLKFINLELKPFINERYNTIPKDSAYFGHSLGGLFGVYVLLHHPESFTRYIIGSPALWWDNGFLLSDAQAFVDSGRQINAEVYMAVGGKEEHAQPDNHWVSNVQKMDEILRSYESESFSVKTEVFPEEAHVSVFGMLHSRGLRAVYGPAKCSPFQPEQCLVNEATD